MHMTMASRFNLYSDLVTARALAWPKYAGGGAVPSEQVPGGNSSVNFGDN